MIASAPWRKILQLASTTCLALFAVCTFTAIVKPHAAQAAQTIPYKINFQGRLTDNNGNIVADGLYNIKFTLYNASTGGTNVWQEYRQTTHRVQITNGLFNVQFGDVTALSPTIFNSSSPVYLEVELPTPATATCSTSNCASFTEGPLTPRQPVAASPYAFNADTLDGVDGATYARKDQANTFTADQTVSGTVTATELLQGTNQVCDVSNNCDYAAISGSTNYIQNGTGGQTANFKIQSADAASVGGVIKGAASQTADLLQLQNSSGNVLARFDAAGKLGIGATAPAYAVDIRSSTIANSTIHISGANNDTGAYMQDFGTSGSFRSQNAYHNGSQWVAKGTSASIVGQANGTTAFYGNTGLTVGTAFTPNTLMTIGPTGVATSITTTLNSGNSAANQSTLTVSPSSAASTSTTYVGSYGLATTSNSNVNSYTSLAGVQGISQSISSGTIGSTTGGGFYTFNQGTGTITAASGVLGSVLNTSSSGTITTANALQAGSPTNVGTIGTANGVLIQAQKIGSVTNAYGINQQGANDKNYFAGNVGINNSGPANKLTINTATTADNTAQVLIASGSTGNKGVVIQGAASQTGNLLEIQSSTGTPLAKITSSGAIYQGSNQVCDAGNNCNYVTAADLTGYAPASGSANYIQNGTSAQTADFNITGDGTIGGTLGVDNANVSSALQVFGTTLIKTTSADALQIQDGSSNLLLSADTSDMIVKIGTTDVPNLSGVSLLVGSLEAQGGLQVGNAVDYVLFDPITHEPLLYGGARHTKKITLTPEYAGAVLDTSGANGHNGTMTSGLDNTDKLNFYNWTTTNTTTNDFDVVIQVPLPSGWDEWAASDPIRIYTNADSTTNCSVSMTTYNGAGTTDLSNVDITPSSASTWQNKNPGSLSQSYAANSIMTIRLHLASKSNCNVKVSTITLDYLSKF